MHVDDFIHEMIGKKSIFLCRNVGETSVAYGAKTSGKGGADFNQVLNAQQRLGGAIQKVFSSAAAASHQAIDHGLYYLNILICIL